MESHTLYRQCAELLNVTTRGKYRYHWVLTVKLLKQDEGEYKKTLLKHLNFEFHQNDTQEFKCRLSNKQTDRLMLFREKSHCV